VNETGFLAWVLSFRVVQWLIVAAIMFPLGFVKGCDWKAARAATVKPAIRPVASHAPILPWRRDAKSLDERLRDAAKRAADALKGIIVPLPLPPEQEPKRDPISTPQIDEQAAVDNPSVSEIWNQAITPRAIAERPPAPPQCGPQGCPNQAGQCTTGNCNRRPAGGGYTHQRRGLFGRRR